MGWNRRMETAADMLDGIVALLLSLADLAERAAGASDAKRRLVLAILRHGEGFTCSAFNIAEHPASDSQASTAAAESGDAPEDALALAMWLRFLALLVRGMGAPHRRVKLALKVRGACGIHHGVAMGWEFPSTHHLDTS